MLKKIFVKILFFDSDYLIYAHENYINKISFNEENKNSCLYLKEFYGEKINVHFSNGVENVYVDFLKLFNSNFVEKRMAQEHQSIYISMFCKEELNSPTDKFFDYLGCDDKNKQEVLLYYKIKMILS